MVKFEQYFTVLLIINALNIYNFEAKTPQVVTSLETIVKIENPQVTTPLGIVEGYWARTTNNRQYAAFDGVPYALPPVGEHRFEDPQPIGRWSDIWKANSKYKCLQYNHYAEPRDDSIVGQEDCLYLNIYTPSPNTTNNYDVIVFIHGGAFMFNTGSTYGHKFIMDNDVVFVSINHRLGPLGFLSTEDSVLPGNNGLKDQLMALKWIKNNIEYFGGNSNSVTLAGMSAGAASVQIHYISPLSQGLFQRGIAQSGTALNNWVLVENSLEKAKKLASLVGCDHEDSRLLVNCLRKRPARQIVDTVKHFLKWLYNPFSPFGVVVDKFAENPVLPDHPYNLIKKGRYNNLPLIFSCVQSEGLYPTADFFREPEYLEQIDKNWNELMPHILDYNYTVPAKKEVDDVSQKIRAHYFQDKSVNKESFPILVKMVTDRLFIADIELGAKLQAASTNATIYFYYFSYRGAHSKSEKRANTNENFGTTHGDDTAYILPNTIDTTTTADDRNMTQILVNMWTTYIKTGIPNLNNINWIPLSQNFNDNINYAHIESPTKIKMKTVNTLGSREFWHSLGLLENQNLLNTETK